MVYVIYSRFATWNA